MVTSQKDQIQSLIADIEQVLAVSKPKTPWIRASDTAAQRQTLERAQAYLARLQSDMDAPGGWGPVDPSTGQLAAPIPTPVQSANAASDQAATGQEADALLQALLTEMRFLKNSALEPLRTELDSLRQQRDQLDQEVKSLAERREAETLAIAEAKVEAQVAQRNLNAEVDEQQLNEFLQALMVRLQESLSVQVTETLGQLEQEHTAVIAKLSAATEAELMQLRPADTIEEMRQLQSRSDQLLANIDVTLQRMFDTLQTNISSYQLSLNEGIENMHSLGRQGEVIVRSLVDHLTQQLGQSVPSEPAFFQKPDDERSLPEGDDRAQPALEPESPTSVRSDTVSSLDEVLPEPSADQPVYASSMADSVYSEGAISPSEPLLPNLDASEPDTASEDTPENFLREDGTIDLDLLKLDIDRSEDDPSLTRDDMMVDAAEADAAVAAQEAEDPAIEAKVMPTEDAAFLADLTLDDLTQADDEADSSADADETAIAGATLLQDIADSSSEPDAPDEMEAAVNLELESLSDDADAPELSAVLPDFGPASDPAATAATLAVDSVDSVAAEEDAAAPQLDDARVDDALMADLANTPESAVESGVDISGVSEPTLDDIGSDGDAYVSQSAEIDPLSTYELPRESTRESGRENTDTDAVSDGLDGEADAPLAATESLTDIAFPSADVDELAAEISGIDTSIDEDLFANLETLNSDAIENASAQPEPHLDELASDLEESIVFEGDVPPVPVLSDTEEGPDSSLIPDPPEQTLSPDQSFDDVLESLEAEAAEAAANAEKEAEARLAKDLPAGFDDDLDFYNRSSAASADQDAESAEPAVDDDASSHASSNGTNGANGSLPSNELNSLMGFAGAPGPEADQLTPEVAADLAAQPVAPDNAIASSEATEPSTLPSPNLQPPDDEAGLDDAAEGGPASWFLGIDFGSTGISAVLINQLGEQVYPLCWQIPGDTEDSRFRLPAVASVDETGSGAPQINQVGPDALKTSAPVIRTLKLLLKTGIPEGASGGPWIQWTDQISIPLSSLQQAVSDLLAMLSPERGLCQALGLKASALKKALSSLSGVVVGYPSNWPDTYSFNVREAILAAGLVSSPQQIFFLEESIAALLSVLPVSLSSVDLEEEQQPGLYNCKWQGGTVVISAGATLTEAAVANIPADLDQLAYSDFVSRSYTYAGDAIDQDIVCQLMHLPLMAIANNAEDLAWSGLALDRLTLPQPGEADRVNRHRLRQRLNDSPLGRELLEAAREVKTALQEEDEVEVQVGDRVFTITRKALETKIFLPYIQRIHRQVNTLLGQKGLSAQGVKQVVCTGGSASLGAIARWLRQKFPNATIIQDTYTGDFSNSCSRIAYGLANLCHYPRVLDTKRHQYSDYFLLLELLRVLPEQPLPSGGILHLLEERGIDTRLCQPHILALIEGRLPPGLVPTEGDRPLISARESNIALYQSLAELPLFRKQGGQIYIADVQQGARLKQHLETLLATKTQSLSEPLRANALMQAQMAAV